MLKKYLLGLCLLLTALALPAQEDCDCGFEFDPVCVVDEFGETITLPSACFAECLGFSAEDFVECEEWDGGEGTDCDCFFDFNPVCVSDEFGEIHPFPNACFAECEGFTTEDFVDCGEIDDGYDCDCDFEEFEPVCVTDEAGGILFFPSACFAECEGYTTEDFGDCDDIDIGFPDCDCDFS
ncbi:MAG: Kazal-type serine protease inhibitor domain-containing protein, partial [Bacteroidota bacterium]